MLQKVGVQNNLVRKRLTFRVVPVGIATMKTKTPLLTLTLCLAAAAYCFASPSPMMGSWKLNAGKSKITAGSGKNNMVVYSDAGGGKVKVTTDGVDGTGKATHSEWTGK